MPTALETAQSRLDAYLQAEAAILSGQQEGTVAGRKWRFADLSEIRAQITFLQNQVAGLQEKDSGQSRLYTAVPR